MTGQDIIKKAKGFLSRTSYYVYWYGGKGQRCTQSLLNTLSKMYPKIYTKTYIANCKKDIENGKYAIDCSGLVCECYRVDHIGTSQFNSKFKTTKTLKPGMILWRSGHCAIYIGDNKLIEAKNQSKDVVESTYVPSNWTRIYYMDGVEYENEKVTQPQDEILTTIAAAPKKVTPKKITWTVNATELNLRRGYSVNYPIIGVLKKGEQVRWYGYTNNTEDWVYVLTNLGVGWVSKKYLR